MPPPGNTTRNRGGSARGNPAGSSHRSNRPMPNRGSGHRPQGKVEAKRAPLHLKKEKTKYHQEKFRRERAERGGTDGGELPQARRHGNRAPPSHRTKEIDVNLASKVSQELRSDISRFRTKMASVDLFGKDLNRMFKLVPPTFVVQHLPSEVSSFRTYMSKFQRGSPSGIDAFISWYEWASFEVNKGRSFHQQDGRVKTDEMDTEQVEKPQKSQTQQVLAQTLRERGHVKALLQMCLRHNSGRRREGQHAFINHLKAKLSEEAVDCRSLELLRATAHHSVAYALSRLILGMVTDNLAMAVLHCHALYLVLTETPITAAVVLALLEEELALSARMAATRQRLGTSHRNGHRAPDNEEELDLVDPDDINDPTKGERNQRLTAAVFALGSLVCSKAVMSEETARSAATFLSYCYVEQKATRVVSANMLFLLLERRPSLFNDDDVMQWATYAFFFYPKMEYFRPEAIQLILRLMEAEAKPNVRCLPDTVEHYATLDPLDSATLEQMVNALFRKEQVTATYPMVHPVWDDLFDLVLRRCAAGESMKEHLSTFVHTAIAPYRRGNVDIPRRALFQELVTRLGQVAVQNADAEQRAELLHMASKNVGYGKHTLAKSTPMDELRLMPISSLGLKVRDLLKQYRATKDSDPASVTNRTWVLRELRNCLYVPVRDRVECPYVNEAVKLLLTYGFYPPLKSRDENSKNRCIYLFADVFSFTYNAALARPKCTLHGLDIIRDYLAAEGRGATRYATALKQSDFRKARDCIVSALEKQSERSVLFYDKRDMEVMLTLLFLILSVDDPSNDEAKTIATSVVPDLVHFYLTGTLETLDLFVDVLMVLIMRVSSPLQVMPLMTCVRRVATGFMLKLAKHIRSKASLDLILAPLRDAFATDSREIARQRKAKGAAAEDDESDDGNESEGDANFEEDEKDEHEIASDGAEADEEESVTEVDEEMSESEASTDEEEEPGDDATDLGADEEDEDALEEEELPTQQYIDALTGLVGNIDLEHSYPTNSDTRKTDVVRAVQLASRVGLAMRSPAVIHVYQVLLAVCRENIKSSDDVIFDSTVSSMEMLLMTKNRYFGQFVPATSLFQLLGDIQSYARKLERAVLSKDSTTVKAAATARRRLGKLKSLAIRTLHFVAMLAYKNHAGEGVRITLAEYYKSIFCDRGWDMRKLLPNVKKDLYHYRQGFAWALLPAVLEKFDDVSAIDGPQRVRVFTGCCIMVESMLSRLSGLPNELKVSTSAALRGFLQSVTLDQVYAMKHTLPYTYLHAVKMVIQYNSRVQLDTEWVSTHVVDKAIEDDELLLSNASIRVLASLERLLNKTPKARETKAATPVKVLYQQFEKAGAKEKRDFYKRAKRVRSKILKMLLAHRNDDPTEEERATRRRRREELKVEDRLQRQVLREASHKILTKEEREEKRRNLLRAKQERIARNRERKRRLHEARQRSFERWRQAKLVEAASTTHDDGGNEDN